MAASEQFTERDALEVARELAERGETEQGRRIARLICRALENAERED